MPRLAPVTSTVLSAIVMLLLQFCGVCGFRAARLAAY
jgi:hypothetical protein